ncbi:MAG: hypothetical protein V2G42_08010 [bacterium JZ-2024 1]
MKFGESVKPRVPQHNSVICFLSFSRLLILLHLALFALLGALLSLFLYNQTGGYLYDDAYISFTYARNFARGAGFIYQPGSSVLGTTAPLYALVLGLLHRLTRVDIPLLAVILSGVFLGCLSALVWFHFPSRRRWVRLFAALLTLSNPLLWKLSATGMETCFFLLLLTATTIAPIITAPFLGTAATFTRPEAAIFTLARILLDSKSSWRSRLMVTIAFAGIGLMTATLTIASGLSVFPHSVVAKAWFFSVVFPMGNQSRILLENLLFKGFLRRLWVLLSLIATFILLRRPERSRWLAFVVLSVSIFVFLYALNFPVFPWYLAPLAFSTILMSLVCADDMMERFRSRGVATAGCVVVPLIFTIAVFRTISADRNIVSELRVAQHAQLSTTGAVVRYLQAHAKPHHSILLPEIGLIGYHTELHILDWGGLVSPELAPYIRRNDLFEALFAFEPDFFLYMLSSRAETPFTDPIQSSTFKNRYKEVLRLPREPPLGDYVLFQKRPSAPL